MDTNETTWLRRLRAYAPEFKLQVVAEGEQPGASVVNRPGFLGGSYT